MALSLIILRTSERRSGTNKWHCRTTVWNGLSYDETDNNTSRAAPLYVLKAPIYGMDDIFHREDERRKTFDKWPHDFIDKNQLAQTGMFFTGEDDKVKCYFCEVEIGEWQREDQPVAEHIRFSHNCPLLRRRTTNNVPISAEALDRALPPISYDICGAEDEDIEVRPNAYAEGTIASCSGNPQPVHPEYLIEAARKRSFAEWPRHMAQKPDQLAEAGFFYTGIGDCVQCFSCGGALKDWDTSDEPWEQHALWLSKCRFLKLMKGQSFIDAVLRKQKAATSSGEKSSEEIVGRASLKSDNERRAPLATVEEKLCKICFEHEYNTAFLPCGHVVACAKCASSVTKCPLCRKSFTDVMRVFFS